ncbi:MAG: 23S rRNA (uracil(1939)-C(5))-methyltransferase RlmD [Clostridia bacterium]|nr:23S rRNA (uracil(1939)-C(5))-methyltransferase RlmD [Clostridia bacterium]
MRKNDIITLSIDDITVDGSGIGKYEGMAVFVPLTAVGDIAEVRILKVKKTYCFAKLERIITPSSERISQECEVFNRCGGCATRHITYESECKLKQNKVYSAIKRIGGIDIAPQPIIPSDRTERYRNKAQYPLSQNGKAGFFARHSHRIIQSSSCLLQPEIFEKAVVAAEKWIKDYKISVYDESSNSGLLRHIYLRLAEKTGEIMFTAVINGNALPHSDKLVSELKAVCGENLKSVQINVNTLDTNVILGDKCKTVYGEDFITDILCGIKVRLSPLSFYQVNRNMAERLYLKASEYANPYGKTILDLYCGAGTIGLSMAKSAKTVIGVEIVPQAVKDAVFNAEMNGIKNARFICADAKSAAAKLASEGLKPDVVIVDPPRKGCSEEVLKTIAEDFNPDTIVYISCDPATLARDVAFLSDKGYILKEYTPVDLFPRTTHIETVAFLSQK